MASRNHSRERLPHPDQQCARKSVILPYYWHLSLAAEGLESSAQLKLHIAMPIGHLCQPIRAANRYHPTFEAEQLDPTLWEIIDVGCPPSFETPGVVIFLAAPLYELRRGRLQGVYPNQSPRNLSAIVGASRIKSPGRPTSFNLQFSRG